MCSLLLMRNPTARSIERKVLSMTELTRTARRKAFDDALRSSEVSNAVARASAAAAARARRQYALHVGSSTSPENCASGSTN